MTHDVTPTTPNQLKHRDPELFREVKRFRGRFEEMLLDTLDHVIENPRFRDRGHFLPREDIRAIAQVVRMLTSDAWTENSLDEFDEAWRDARRSDFFAEAFESVRFRIENAVRAGRARLQKAHGKDDVTQGTLW